jgi:hypothetical protein
MIRRARWQDFRAVLAAYCILAVAPVVVEAGLWGLPPAPCAPTPSASRHHDGPRHVMIAATPWHLAGAGVFEGCDATFDLVLDAPRVALGPIAVEPITRPAARRTPPLDVAVLTRQPGHALTAAPRFLAPRHAYEESLAVRRLRSAAIRAPPISRGAGSDAPIRPPARLVARIPPS